MTWNTLPPKVTWSKSTWNTWPPRKMTKLGDQKIYVSVTLDFSLRSLYHNILYVFSLTKLVITLKITKLELEHLTSETQNTYITPDDYYNTNIITRQIFSSQVNWLYIIVIPTSHYVEFQYIYVANARGYKWIK